jgi:hypothetical protein
MPQSALVNTNLSVRMMLKRKHGETRRVTYAAEIAIDENFELVPADRRVAIVRIQGR